MSKYRGDTWLYVIIDAKTDLPLYVCDTRRQAIQWLGCSSATFWAMLEGCCQSDEAFAKRLKPGYKHSSMIRATYKVEVVREPSDEEIENWFLTKGKECAIIGDGVQVRACADGMDQLYKMP